jgi:hypothetical protein
MEETADNTPISTLPSTSNQKIYGISYVSRYFAQRHDVVTKEAEQSGFFHSFKCFTETDIDDHFKYKMVGSQIWNSHRGGGWWTWKIYVIWMQLKQMQDGDVLVYYDGGCILNVTEESTKRFWQYINMVNDHNHCGMLRFELPFREKDFTNRYTLEYFNKKMGYSMDMLNNIYQQNMLVGGIIIMRKNEFSVRFFDIAMHILQDDPKLWTEYYTQPGETHRHDQSVLSILYRLMDGDLYLNDETYYDEGRFDGEIAKTKPFWAARQRC